MSGICGAWSFKGPEAALDPVLSALERRGPDRSQSWADGPVALGHTLLGTTPEALLEVLPLTDSASGCTITADARIDNRDELIAALNLAAECRTIGDGELILRAYLRWGDDCPAKLLGDFAFAVWDPRSDRLFCARDHMGMRQLIYFRSKQLFAFATEVEALTCHPDVPKEINDGRIGDFLEDLEGVDLTSTFFEHLFRLPPAHSLTVSNGAMNIRQYWKLNPGETLNLDNDEAYAQAFLKVFTEAVQCRLRSTGGIGSMLSGGVDSNSVAAVASDLLAARGDGPLRTFSAVGPNPGACIETEMIEAALKSPGFSSTKVDYTDLALLIDDLKRLTEETGEPFDRNMTLVRAVYLLAHRAGISVMLDGVGGDIVLTSSNRVAAYVRRIKLRAAWREALGEERFWKVKRHASKALIRAIWTSFVPKPVRKLAREAIQRSRTARNLNSSLISKTFAKSIDLPSRWLQFLSHMSGNNLSDAQARAESIRHPHLTVGRERYDRVAAQLGIEPRDPFLDVRVIQFCLSLPAAQLQHGGWPKIILRRAVEGLVPKKVAWRSGKEHLGWLFTQALFDHWQGWSERVREFRPVLSRYLSRLALAEPSGHGSSGHGKREFLVSDLDTFFITCWLIRHASSLKRRGQHVDE